MAAKPKTLKSRARDLLLQKYHARGGHRSNLWLFYSTKTKLDWVVTSDLEFDHAVLLEATPEIVRFDLSPEAIIVKVGEDDHKTTFDALVWFKEGGPQAREVKTKAEEENPTLARTIHQREAQCLAATQLGARRVVVTQEDMAESASLIINWRRVIAYMSATRDLPMGSMMEACALKLRSRREMTIGELVTDIRPEMHSTFLSAAFSLHQQGHYATDLSEKPLSLSTRFWATEVQS